MKGRHKENMSCLLSQLLRSRDTSSQASSREPPQSASFAARSALRLGVQSGGVPVLEKVYKMQSLDIAGNCRIRFDFAGSASGITVWDQILIGRISIVGSDSSGTVGMVGTVGMIGTVRAQPVRTTVGIVLYDFAESALEGISVDKAFVRDGRDG